MLVLCVIKQLKKILKLISQNLNPETAPFTHSLSYLAKKGGFYESFEEFQKEFIDEIEPLNIEARYPSHKERLLRSLTDKKCIELINNTKSLQLWIKEKLSLK